MSILFKMFLEPAKLTLVSSGTYLIVTNLSFRDLIK